jgi:tRNA threonylcarbamoyladenosine dehydratase
MQHPEEEFRNRVQPMTDGGWTSRTRLLLGDERVDAFRNKHVLVLGLGGVGSYCAEFLVRAGIGRLTIVDGDVVDPSNRNRQLPALVSTEGLFKADVMRQRLELINPMVRLIVIKEFLEPSHIERVLATKFDFVVDAIDSLTPKIVVIQETLKRGYPIVSSMGAGGKTNPALIRIGDIAETQQCKLAKMLRKRLHKSGIFSGVQAVYSLEQTDADSLMYTDGTNFKKSAYGTVSYMPAAFGGACASVVITGL